MFTELKYYYHVLELIYFLLLPGDVTRADLVYFRSCKNFQKFLLSNHLRHLRNLRVCFMLLDSVASAVRCSISQSASQFHLL